MLYTYATVSKYSRDEVDWFFDAVASGEHQVLSELISEGYSDTKMRDAKGNTPLFKVQDRDTAMVLLKYGADVNARNNNLETPLFAAARRRNAVVTKCLLQNGADVHAKDKNGYTALFTAASAENATMLINHGANVHALDSYGRTPLFAVVWGSTPDVVEAVIKAGANVHATDRFGQTPMFQLYGKGRARCLEVLIRYGAYETHRSTKLPNMAALKSSSFSCTMVHAFMETCCIKNLRSSPQFAMVTSTLPWSYSRKGQGSPWIHLRLGEKRQARLASSITRK
uniref:Uncharacterized protein n=1 Tax=Globisporangium ultimum (strain ATCC 200006 / CBS 805.95 / DAOM BR144) TaxID=431595 RepID=K3XB70_GLOUD